MNFQKGHAFSRRQMLGAMLFGAGAARAADSGQSCGAPTPASVFRGVIARTAADSKPSLLQAPQPRAGSPNIIYIVLDDTGFSDLHCYGSEVATPNIDSLAARGLFYNQFHSKAVCSPSRASLLTGRNSHAVGMKELAENDQGYPHSRGRITPAAATIAQILRANGYGTMGVGKWHLTPTVDVKASGDRSHWPLQKGFNRWYGFLSGWTDQYHPSLIENNHAIQAPNKLGYHFSVDIVDQAIKMVGDHVTADARKPFFLYTAFGAAHAPIQVPREYIEKYVPVFQKGWDVIREERYRRQLEMGVIPRNTRLPARNPGDPAWSDLGNEERAVFTRFMAAYAGFLEHADEQVGRLVRFLKERNLFDNTVIFLVSDNGGAPEAGTRGGFARPYGDQTTVHDMYQRLGDLGSDKTQPLYQRPWAMVSDTPFKFYKLWPYRGGVNTPFIVSWPARINSFGLRRQFVDIIDITPTVLDITGIQAPTIFEGVCQIPMQGSRGIWADGWSAVAAHKPGTDFDTDRWELYHVAEDYSESQNVAAQYPEKLAEMKKLWWSEAAKNGALPQLEAPGPRQHTYDQALDGRGQ